MVKHRFCQMKVDLTSGMKVSIFLIFPIPYKQTFTLHRKFPYICGPYKRGALYWLSGPGLKDSNLNMYSSALLFNSTNLLLGTMEGAQWPIVQYSVMRLTPS